MQHGWLPRGKYSINCYMFVSTLYNVIVHVCKQEVLLSHVILYIILGCTAMGRGIKSDLGDGDVNRKEGVERQN
jgi:hypothetical protein